MNPYMFGFGTDTAFHPTPTPSNSQSSFFVEHTSKSSSSSTPSTIDQEWDNVINAAWNDTSVTPKLIQRQLKRREQNRASQRAFRERKERHAKCLQEKIDQLEVKLQEMDNSNTDLERQLAELRDRREYEYEEMRKSVSPENGEMHTPTILESSTPPTCTVDTGKWEGLCRKCRSLGPAVQIRDHTGRPAFEHPQLFLP